MGQGDGLFLSHFANGLRDLVPLLQNGTKQTVPLSHNQYTGSDIHLRERLSDMPLCLWLPRAV